MIAAGHGAAVVDGNSVDTWVVGGDAKYVVENPVQRRGAMLRNDQVLSLARIAGEIRRAAVSANYAENLDLEFVIDEADVLLGGTGAADHREHQG